MVDDPNRARVAGLLAALIDLFAAADLDGVEARAISVILLPKLEQRSGMDGSSRALVASVLLPHMPPLDDHDGLDLLATATLTVRDPALACGPAILREPRHDPPLPPILAPAAAISVTLAVERADAGIRPRAARRGRGQSEDGPSQRHDRQRRECGFGGQSAVAAAIRNATRKSGPYTARVYNDVARIRATFHSPEYRLFAHRSSPICSQ
jgi:hypothetical protein